MAREWFFCKVLVVLGLALAYALILLSGSPAVNRLTFAVQRHRRWERVELDTDDHGGDYDFVRRRAGVAVVVG